MITRLTSFFRQNVLLTCVALVFLLLPTGTAPPLIGVGIAGIAWVLGHHFRQVPIILTASWFRPLYLFLTLPWIGLTYSGNLDLALNYALKTNYWCLVFVSGVLIIDDRQAMILVKALWAGLAAGAFLALAQVLDLVPMIRDHFAGFGIVHTLVCMYLLVGIMMAAFYFKRARTGYTRILMVVLIVLFMFHIAVLDGRSGYLIFIVVSPLVANDLMHRYPASLKITVAGLLCLAVVLSPVVQKRLKNTASLLNDNKTQALHGDYIEEMPRFHMLKLSVDSICAHPFTGIGTAALGSIASEQGLTHPHNNLLYMGVSFGVAGILALLWVFWKLFSISWRCRHTVLGYFVFSSSLVLFLGGMFDTQMLNTGTLIMLAVMYGFLNALSSEQYNAAKEV